MLGIPVSPASCTPLLLSSFQTQSPIRLLPLTSVSAQSWAKGIASPKLAPAQFSTRGAVPDGGKEEATCTLNVMIPPLPDGTESLNQIWKLVTLLIGVGAVML